MATISRQWILNQDKRDFLFILFPGLIGIFLSLLISEENAIYILYAFFAFVFIDSGHVYITLWRTVFRRDERESHLIYWATPLLILVIVILWLKLQIPYLWSAVVYFTIFHHIRQFFGILRWYEKLNRRFCRYSENFLYLLTGIPFLLFHFRDLHNLGLYTEKDIFFYPSTAIFNAGLFVYFLIIAVWIMFEIQQARKKGFELNRVLAVFCPAVLYGFCFIKGTNLAQIVIPLLLSHGIPYFAIMDVSLQKLNPNVFKNIFITLLILILTAIILGYLEHFVEENVLQTMNAWYFQNKYSWFQIILTAVYLIPVLSHFVWDAYIWTGKHREAKVVYS